MWSGAGRGPFRQEYVWLGAEDGWISGWSHVASSLWYTRGLAMLPGQLHSGSVSPRAEQTSWWLIATWSAHVASSPTTLLGSSCNLVNHYSYPVPHILASHLVIVNCALDLHSIPSLLLVVKNLPANAGDMSSIPGSGRSTGEGNGNPLQCSCLEKPMDRRAWWVIIHGFTKSWTQLSNFLYWHSGLSFYHFHKSRLQTQGWILVWTILVCGQR